MKQYKIKILFLLLRLLAGWQNYISWMYSVSQEIVATKLPPPDLADITPILKKRQ